MSQPGLEKGGFRYRHRFQGLITPDPTAALAEQVSETASVLERVVGAHMLISGV